MICVFLDTVGSGSLCVNFAIRMCLASFIVEAGFQRAMGITLERGRFVGDDDDEHAPVVIDIDEVFANTDFPRHDPIGRRVHIAGFDAGGRIVGVVEHIRQWGPGNDPKSAIEAEFFYPFMQLPPKLMRLVANGVAVVLRTNDDPAAIMEPVRKVAFAFNPGAVIYGEQTMSDVIANSMAARRLSMILLGVFAGIVVLLVAWDLCGHLLLSVI
jgi:hypothetical protein